MILIVTFLNKKSILLKDSKFWFNEFKGTFFFNQIAVIEMELILELYVALVSEGASEGAGIPQNSCHKIKEKYLWKSAILIHLHNFDYI